MADEEQEVPERKIRGTVDTDPGCLTVIFMVILISALWSISSELSGIRRELVLSRCYQSAAQGVLCPEAERSKGKGK